MADQAMFKIAANGRERNYSNSLSLAKCIILALKLYSSIINVEKTYSFGTCIYRVFGRN